MTTAFTDREIAQFQAALDDPKFNFSRSEVMRYPLAKFLATIAKDRAELSDVNESLAACRHQITLQMARVEKVAAENKRLTRVAEKLETAAVYAVKRAEAVEAEVERLREALKPFAGWVAHGVRYKTPANSLAATTEEKK